VAMTKKEAAFRQITAAIKHFESEEYECAITLAGAAEGQLFTEDGSRDLFSELKMRVPPEFKDKQEWVARLNETRDWLKHPTPQLGDEWDTRYRRIPVPTVPSVSGRGPSIIQLASSEGALRSVRKDMDEEPAARPSPCQIVDRVR
jgi:hypothetical protein